MCSNGGRHLFTPEARDRGYPAEDPTHSFGSFDELRSAGFLVNDTLRLSASVRSTCHLLKRRLAASKAAVSLTWPRRIESGRLSDLAATNPSVCCQVRVHPGKHQCTVERIAHPMLKGDGLRAHIARAFGECAFYCDLCLATLSSERLHCCSEGCNFDICDSCVEQRAGIEAIRLV